MVATVLGLTVLVFLILILVVVKLFCMINDLEYRLKQAEDHSLYCYLRLPAMESRIDYLLKKE